MLIRDQCCDEKNYEVPSATVDVGLFIATTADLKGKGWRRLPRKLF
jgi:hypothetical protein